MRNPVNRVYGLVDNLEHGPPKAFEVHRRAANSCCTASATASLIGMLVFDDSAFRSGQNLRLIATPRDDGCFLGAAKQWLISQKHTDDSRGKINITKMEKRGRCAYHSLVHPMV